MRSTSLPRRFFMQKGLAAFSLSTQSASFFIASSTLTTHAQSAADYPTKPVKIVVGFPAGGGTDVFARALAQGLQARLGGSFLLDNKPGAGGVVASSIMLQAPPDGLMLLLGSTSTQVISHRLRISPASALCL
jgi:tripartite-type tricarboxylate transporter receptor subunit TctC